VPNRKRADQLAMTQGRRASRHRGFAVFVRYRARPLQGLLEGLTTRRTAPRTEKALDRRFHR
jgi:hypothetical protein